MRSFVRSGPVSLYLHFPFCERKCRYCDFLSGPAGEKTREEYIELLRREIALRAAEVPGEVDTVFIGGGTPSIMTPGQLARVMDAVRSAYRLREDAEISMEVNPGTTDPAGLAAYREAGINRLSIGVQSFDDRELQLLGRIHTASDARETFGAAREAGFDNINLDLMSALPGQNIETWSRTLQEAVSLGPEHLSAYSLIIEEGTPLDSMLRAGALPALPSEEEDRRIYHYTKAFLAANGYRRYEISNYAREGYACRHNCGYWTGHAYLGLGLGAASLLGGERFRNPAEFGEYREKLAAAEGANHVPGPSEDPPQVSAAQPGSSMEVPDSSAGAPDLTILRCERQVLTPEEKMEEFLFLGLRMTQGVSEEEFCRRFGIKPEEKFGSVLRRHLEQKVIRRTTAGDLQDSGEKGGAFPESRIALTDYGMDVANYVMADYLL